MIFLGPWPAAGPKKSALAASGCIKISLALTWIPLKKYKIKNKKKLKNIVHRETRNERRDLTASLCVLIND
jgi:hypothetical protein